jgi:hypothetical protein
VNRPSQHHCSKCTLFQLPYLQTPLISRTWSRRICRCQVAQLHPASVTRGGPSRWNAMPARPHPEARRPRRQPGNVAAADQSRAHYCSCRVGSSTLGPPTDHPGHHSDLTQLPTRPPRPPADGDVEADDDPAAAAWRSGSNVVTNSMYGWTRSSGGTRPVGDWWRPVDRSRSPPVFVACSDKTSASSPWLAGSASVASASEIDSGSCISDSTERNTSLISVNSVVVARNIAVSFARKTADSG